ncbi:MAG: hypothetical protein AAGI17_09140 [Planctomycetota bacterium]
MPRQTVEKTGPESEPQTAPETPRVHFSQGGLEGGGGQVPMILLALLPQSLFVLGLCAFGGAIALDQFTWMPVYVRVAIVSTITLAVLAVIVRFAARALRRANNVADLPMKMDETVPCNVICWADQRDRLRGLDAGSFEPEVFRTLLAERISMAQGGKSFRMLLRRFYLPAIMSISMFLVLGFTGILPNGSRSFVLIVPLTLVGGVAFWMILEPTYFRVAPGRLDVFRFRAFRSTPQVTTHDLRAAPIRLDCRRAEVLIGGWHAAHEADSEDADAHEQSPEPKEPAWKSKSFFQHLNESNTAMKDPQAALGSERQRRELKIVPLWSAFDQKGLLDAVYRACATDAQHGPLPDDRLN